MKKTLIELTTDLKSLKYSSGEKPYVVKDINNPVSTNGLVREVTARVDDLSRISQMLVDAPGAKYLAHEAMLQQIGVQNRIKNSGDKPLKAVLNEIGKTVVGTTKIVASTLAQVPANGTGTHFVKAFGKSTYTSDVSQDVARVLDGSRIVFPRGVNKYIPTTDLQEATYKRLQIGPLSNKNGDVIENATVGELEIPKPRRLSDLSENSVEFITVSPKDIGDNFLQQSFVHKDFQGSTVFDYSMMNKNTRVYLGNQNYQQKGDSSVKYTNSSQPSITWNSPTDGANIDRYRDTRVDGVNMYTGTTPKRSADLVALYFINVNTGKVLQFRAFIDSIDDSYNADWQGTRYVGRAEEFYTYGGFSRDINISFKIAAATSVEMKPLYYKMNQLAAMTAPKYTTAGVMQGTVVKMNIGYYITDLPGVITSVKYSLVEDAPWEIGLKDPYLNTEIGTAPTVLQCSVSFKAIHDFAPTNNISKYFGNLKNI